MLNTLSFIVVIAALKSWQRPPTESELPAERVYGAIRAGLRYARHSPQLRAVLTRGVAFFVFASASWALLPLFVRQELHSAGHLWTVLGLPGCRRGWRRVAAAACSRPHIARQHRGRRYRNLLDRDAGACP